MENTKLDLIALAKVRRSILERHRRFESGPKDVEDIAQDAVIELLTRAPQNPAAYAARIASNAVKPKRRIRVLTESEPGVAANPEAEILDLEQMVLLMVALEQFITWGDCESTTVYISDFASFDTEAVMRELRFCQAVIDGLPMSERHVRRLTRGLEEALRTALTRSSYRFLKDHPRVERDDAESPWPLPDITSTTEGEPDDALTEAPVSDKWIICNRGEALIRRLLPDPNDEMVEQVVQRAYALVYGSDEESSSNPE